MLVMKLVEGKKKNGANGTEEWSGAGLKLRSGAGAENNLNLQKSKCMFLAFLY